MPAELTDGIEIDVDWRKLLTFAAILGVAVAALLAAYYLRHPEASFFEAFDRRPARIPPSEDVAAAEAAERAARHHE